MKKFYLTVAILVLFIACFYSQKVISDHEDEKTGEEVKNRLYLLLNTFSKLEADSVMEYFADDEFISSMNNRTGVITSPRALSDTIRRSLLRRKEHRSELTGLQVTVLSSTLVLITEEALWENWWKNGTYRKTKGFTTFLWSKKNGKWKIIHMHESGVTLAETTP